MRARHGRKSPPLLLSDFPLSWTSGINRAMLVAIALTASWAIPPARAQVRLPHEAAGGSYNVDVMSWWDIPFRSVIRQQHDFSCGAASLATLLTYHYGRPTPERETFAAMWRLGDREQIRRHGFSLFDMKNFLEAKGYKAAGFKLTIEDFRGVRRPLIVLLDLRGFKHFVVVKGLRGDRVLIGDPVFGLKEYSMADFDAAWEGIALAIMAGPAAGSPRFNLTGDWGPWSRAPREDDTLRLAVGSLTNDLPNRYQITPQLLIPVRVGTVN